MEWTPASLPSDIGGVQGERGFAVLALEPDEPAEPLEPPALPPAELADPEPELLVVLAPERGEATRVPVLLLPEE